MAEARQILPPPRELTPLDAPLVAELFDRCADYFLLLDGVPAGPEDVAELFSSAPPGRDPTDKNVLGWTDASGLFAVAEMAHDYPDPGIWYLGFFAVDPARRGQGLGRAAYAVAEALAAEKGAREMRLAVLEENHGAARFWQALGFAERRRAPAQAFKQRSHVRIEFAKPIG